jgi:hypothetical protein
VLADAITVAAADSVALVDEMTARGANEHCRSPKPQFWIGRRALLQHRVYWGFSREGLPRLACIVGLDELEVVDQLEIDGHPRIVALLRGPGLTAPAIALRSRLRLPATSATSR